MTTSGWRAAGGAVRQSRTQLKMRQPGRLTVQQHRNQTNYPSGKRRGGQCAYLLRIHAASHEGRVERHARLLLPSGPAGLATTRPCTVLLPAGCALLHGHWWHACLRRHNHRDGRRSGGLGARCRRSKRAGSLHLRLPGRRHDRQRRRRLGRLRRLRRHSRRRRHGCGHRRLAGWRCGGLHRLRHRWLRRPLLLLGGDNLGWVNVAKLDGGLLACAVQRG